MMQALLAERFHLTFHREPKDLEVCGLLPAKGGPKFTESNSEGESVTKTDPKKPGSGGAVPADFDGAAGRYAGMEIAARQWWI